VAVKAGVFGLNVVDESLKLEKTVPSFHDLLRVVY
jgi:hypothetical protein